nr:MAG TPA: hypothetical protein [Caudoviricetes sp.]
MNLFHWGEGFSQLPKTLEFRQHLLPRCIVIKASS